MIAMYLDDINLKGFLKKKLYKKNKDRIDYNLLYVSYTHCPPPPTHPKLWPMGSTFVDRFIWTFCQKWE